MATKRQVVSDFRRSEILKAARGVFARKGFVRGIIDEIAKEAGVAKGTVYLYFHSKREIYRAVLHNDMESLNRVTVENIDAESALRDKIRAFVRTRIEKSEAKRDFFKIMDSDSGSLAFTRSQYHNYLKGPVEHMKAAIEEAVRKGEIRPVPTERIAWAITDLTRGTIQRRLSGPENSPSAEEVDFVVNFVWATLRWEPARSPAPIVE
jgi:AcrR family transcriptional regulator